MKVIIGNMTFESDMEGCHDNAAYLKFLKSAVEVEKARANIPLYMPPAYPPQWPSVPTYPAPIITSSTEGDAHAGTD